uniref:NADH:ubiquinone reductase (H(+)-translocating) n=1 Tax=Trichuris sp. LO613 TaxID=2856030 RepID=A0A8F5DQ43_9BILA|nr:NADH dehydrogenase subunit 5 [Trichuris sp. LO613]
MLIITNFVWLMLWILCIFFFMCTGMMTILCMPLSNFNTNLSMTFSSNLIFLFSSIIIFLTLIIIYFSFYYMHMDIPLERFMTLMLLFMISMIIVNNSNSCWTLWLGWEGLGVTSYLLIMYYNNWKSNNAAMTTMMINRIGDFCLLISFISFTNILLWNFNKFNLAIWLIILIMLASVAKSAQLPLNSWLPIAMAAPTPVSSLVHSSTLVVAGSILCIKLEGYFFLYSTLWLSLTGYLTSLYASLMAFLELDFKKILAYSTMSQIALVMFMLCCNLKDLMLMHIINHALIKALLFINVGVYLVSMFSNQDVRLMTMNNTTMMVSSMIIFSLIAMCGITFTSSYYSKEYNLLFSMKEENILMMVNIMIFMSFAYSARMIFLILFNNNHLKIKNFSFTTNLIPNLILFPVMMINGWLFNHNYALPLNMTWTNTKNMIMLLPMIILLMCLYSPKMSIFNHDYMYKMFNNLSVIKFLMMNKMKSMSISFNMTIMTYSNWATLKTILFPMSILVLLMMM